MCLRGCPCKNPPLDFRPKKEFLQIFCVRQLVHMINKISKNLALSDIFQYFWRRFPRTVKIINFRVKVRRCAEDAEKLRFYSKTITEIFRAFDFMFLLLISPPSFFISSAFFSFARPQLPRTWSPGPGAGYRICKFKSTFRFALVRF